MKPIKTTLKLLILGIIVFSGTSCKKPKNEIQAPTPAQLYSVEYRGQITGGSITGDVEYYDPTQQKFVTETIIGTKITRAFTFKKGETAYFTVNSHSSTSNTITSQADIYINGVKKYSLSKSGTYYASAYIYGDIN